MWASLFRSLDATICLNIMVMEAIYLPAVIGRKKLDKEGFARNLILAIVIGWLAVLIFFGNLTIKYWTGLADPTESVADTPVRLIYLVVALVGTTMHIATAQRSRYGAWIHSVALRLSGFGGFAGWTRPVLDWGVRRSGQSDWWCILVLWLTGLVLLIVLLMILDTYALPLVMEWPLVPPSHESLTP